ncbi:hypothetical protein B9Z19DRAFT_1098221 [Tuber borchii]|uniref:Uncharacterized protein n=1 Tax=Tuber borchii TaxID=42251 RepID=A0A2T7A916_TUBBO|nr:hypothetical protein B9Z19DRAFT_1098221 [Tuber borchii]
MSYRAIGRNVHIYDSRDPNTILGGLLVTNGVTNTNFYSMVGIIFIFTTDYTLRQGQKSGPTIKRDDKPLQQGSYFIVTAGPFTINSEPWLIRGSTLPTPPLTTEFLNTIRNRDRRCVVTGTPVGDICVRMGYWRGFQVTHIFPLAHEECWAAGYGHLISNPPVSIDSPQNGILLRSDIRSHFENYTFSINPDDNYKIVFFDEDIYGIAGTHISNLKAFLADPQRPLDQLLRWHYKQAVLANVRGQGEPFFDCDFPPDPDFPAKDLGSWGN